MLQRTDEAFFAIEATGALQGNKCRTDGTNAGFCINETLCSAHGCCVDSIAIVNPIVGLKHIELFRSQS